jgi:hypothetical protein
MELAVEPVVLTDTSEVIISLVGQLKALATRYARKRSSANLVAPWRPPPNESTPPVSRLVKLLGSVCSWLPENFTPHMRQTFRQLLELGIKDVRQSAGLPALEDDPGKEADEPTGGRGGQRGGAGQQGKGGLVRAAAPQSQPVHAEAAPAAAPVADAPGLAGAVPITALGAVTGAVAQPSSPLGQQQQLLGQGQRLLPSVGEENVGAGAAGANGLSMMVPI